MNNPEISIIVPTHNSSEYIIEAAESIQKQSYDDFEVICIDSSSKDDTREKIERFVRSDTRFRLVKDPDSSYGHKLNRGIRGAKGKYIAILESDDVFHRDMLKICRHFMVKEQLDFIKTDRIDFVDLGGRRYEMSRKRCGESEYDTVFGFHTGGLSRIKTTSGIWAGLYRTDFLRINHIALNESPGASYQDTGFAVLCMLYAERVMMIRDQLYFYRNDNQNASVKDSKKSLCIRDEMDWLREEMHLRNIDDDERMHFYFQQKLNSYSWNIDRLENSYALDFRKKTDHEIRRDFLDGNGEVKTEYNTDTVRYILGDPALIEQKEKKKMAESNDFTQIGDLYSSGTDFVMFGSGVLGQKIIAFQRMICKNCLVAVCDSNKERQGTKIGEYTILSPEEACKRFGTSVFVVANRYHSSEMKRLLIENGIGEDCVTVISFFPDEGALLSNWVRYYNRI